MLLDLPAVTLLIVDIFEIATWPRVGHGIKGSCRAYSCCFMCAIDTHLKLLSFKMFSNFVYTSFPTFSNIFPFFAFSPLFWKIRFGYVTLSMGSSYCKSAPCLVWCFWVFHKWRYDVCNLSRDLTRPPHWESMRIYGWESLFYVNTLIPLVIISNVMVEICF